MRRPVLAVFLLLSSLALSLERPLEDLSRENGSSVVLPELMVAARERRFDLSRAHSGYVCADPADRRFPSGWCRIFLRDGKSRLLLRFDWYRDRFLNPRSDMPRAGAKLLRSVLDNVKQVKTGEAGQLVEAILTDALATGEAIEIGRYRHQVADVWLPDALPPGAGLPTFLVEEVGDEAKAELLEGASERRLVTRETRVHSIHLPVDLPRRRSDSPYVIRHRVTYAFHPDGVAEVLEAPSSGLFAHVGMEGTPWAGQISFPTPMLEGFLEDTPLRRTTSRLAALIAPARDRFELRCSHRETLLGSFAAPDCSTSISHAASPGFPLPSLGETGAPVN